MDTPALPELIPARRGFLAFQQLHPMSYESVGGLYIERQFIVAVAAERRPGDYDFEGKPTHRYVPAIHMLNGTIYRVAGTVSEVLDEITRFDGYER